MNIPPFVFVLILFLLAGGRSASAAEERDLGPPPANRVLDLDRLFRAKPEILEKISKRLMSLKEDYDMDVYLVVRSSSIGESVSEIVEGYQEQWLGEESDGLVFFIDGSEAANGMIGRSGALYNGKLLSKGLSSRIEYHDLQRMIEAATDEVKKAEGVVERVEKLTLTMADQLEANLALKKNHSPVKEDAAFMGWMALALVVVGALIAAAARLMGAKEKKESQAYYFPDLTMKKRLQARYGGGKLSCLDFGTDSSAAEQ